MAITFNQIIDSVSTLGQIVAHEPQRIIDGYDIISNGEENINYFSSDILYMGKVSNLPKNISLVVNTNLILLLDDKLPDLLIQSNTANMIIIKNIDDFANICNEIKKIFYIQMKINNYAYGLLNLCQSNCTLDVIMNYAYFAIGNPIMLVDSSLFLISHVGLNSVSDNSIISLILKDKCMPEEYLTEVIEKEMDTLTEKNDIIVQESHLSNSKIYASRIVKHNQLIGYIKVLETNKPVTELEKKYMIILCKFLSISIYKFLSDDFSLNPVMNSFLQGLLQNKITDKGKIEARAKALNLNLQGVKYVITVKPSFVLKSTDSLYVLKRKFATLFNTDSIIVYNDSIVILYITKILGPMDRYMEGFTRILESSQCKAYISLPFEELDEFDRHYKQTQHCIPIAKKLNTDKTIVKYEDLILQHMFLHFNKIFNIEDLINPSTKTLMKIDKEKNSELLNSLFCLLKHNCNYVSAAKELNIHYNTLKYRINRIIELTNIDLEDKEEIFSLLLSKKILELTNTN